MTLIACPECGKERELLTPGSCCRFCGYGSIEVSADPFDDAAKDAEVSDDDIEAVDFCCPQCGGELQVTAYRFLKIDRTFGEADTTDLPERYALYCENDCFLVEDLEEEPEGEEAIDAAIAAIEEAVETASDSLNADTDSK